MAVGVIILFIEHHFMSAGQIDIKITHQITLLDVRKIIFF